MYNEQYLLAAMLMCPCFGS